MGSVVNGVFDPVSKLTDVVRSNHSAVAEMQIRGLWWIFDLERKRKRQSKLGRFVPRCRPYVHHAISSQHALPEVRKKE
jgi:hypothetical protein